MPTKIEKDAVTGRETTGHEWDGIRELEHAAAEMVALYLLSPASSARSVYCVLYPSVPWLHRLFPRAARLLATAARVDEELAAAGDSAGGACGHASAPPSLADIRKDPAAPRLRRDRRPRRLRRQLPALPRRRRRRRQGLSRTWPTTTGSGAARWTTSSRPSPTASAAAIPMRASRRCRASALDGMLNAGADQRRRRLRAVAVRPAAPAEAVAARRARSSPTTAPSVTASKAQGNREVGAPRLTDRIWLYGGDKATVVDADHLRRATA